MREKASKKRVGKEATERQKDEKPDVTRFDAENHAREGSEGK